MGSDVEAEKNSSSQRLDYVPAPLKRFHGCKLFWCFKTPQNGLKPTSNSFAPKYAILSDDKHDFRKLLLINDLC